MNELFDELERAIAAGGEYLIIHSFDDFYNYLKTKNLIS